MKKVASTGKDVEKLELCALLVRMKNGMDTMENIVMSPQNI
jgi:hypothetical protein